MQIIIPMSGFGERFRQAGYGVPKPLIEIDGKPIIAYVIEMFPQETDFLFICNQEHLDTPAYRMKEILQKYCPTGKILGIQSHRLGPVHAVLQAEKDIKLNEPVVVNYCDFTCYWDWHHFKEWIAQIKCDGAVPAYKGFHPHTLGSTQYAYIQEKNGWMFDIQEKKPYTDNRMEEYASSGTYYFSSGKLMLEAFHETVAQNLQVNGEYYVSLTYKPLLAQKHSIAVYELQHFMQWGTPADVAEYLQWSRIFRKFCEPSKKLSPEGSVIVPMAGLGERYAREGYALTKPLIPVSGQPMVVQAVHDLPHAKNYVFVLREDMPGFETICETLRQTYPNACIETVPSVTDGQACTALKGLDALTKKMTEEIAEPLTFGACDNGVLYDAEKFQQLLNEEDTDVIVWGACGHPDAIRNPKAYGWIEADGNHVKAISVKKPLKFPATDPIVIGTFTFKKASDFRKCIQNMMARDGRVNGEFYLDTCINDALALGLRCKWFKVDAFISWGIPSDLRTFEYWQSCFHLWRSHPYDIKQDLRIPTVMRAKWAERYSVKLPPLLD